MIVKFGVNMNKMKVRDFWILFASLMFCVLVFVVVVKKDGGPRVVDVKRLEKTANYSADEFEQRVRLVAQIDWDRSISSMSLPDKGSFSSEVFVVVPPENRLLDVFQYDDSGLLSAYAGSLARFNQRVYDLLSSELIKAKVELLNHAKYTKDFSGKWSDHSNEFGDRYDRRLVDFIHPALWLTVAPWFQAFKERYDMGEYRYSGEHQRIAKRILTEYIRKENDFSWLWISMILSYNSLNGFKDSASLEMARVKGFFRDSAFPQHRELMQVLTRKAWESCGESDLLACWAYHINAGFEAPPAEAVERYLKLCSLGVGCSGGEWIFNRVKTVNELGGEESVVKLVERLRKECRKGIGCSGVVSMRAKSDFFGKFFKFSKEDINDVEARDVKRWVSKQNDFRANRGLCFDGDVYSCYLAYIGRVDQLGGGSVEHMLRDEVLYEIREKICNRNLDFDPRHWALHCK
jgi:hypothetical protein